MIGGLLALYLFCRRKKLSFLMWADIAAPALALGQAIGRWGNFVNQELYGAPTDLPWAISIDPLTACPGMRMPPTTRSSCTNRYGTSPISCCCCG